MKRYEEKLVKQRSGLDEERNVWDFQNKNTGENLLKAWNSLQFT